MTENERNALLEELSNKKMSFSIPSFVAYYLDEQEMQSPSLVQLLGIDESELTLNGNRVLQFLESEKESSPIFNFEIFKWKVHAFLSIQDLLFPQIFDGVNWDIILKIRYFYYESKYVLLESIHSSLNGMYIGNNQLLRLFIEFNLLQVYYLNKGIREQSYSSFSEYFKTGKKPGNNKLIETALPEDKFCKPLRKRIQWELGRLSNRFSHAYTHFDSPKTMGVVIPHTSIDSIYFYVQVSAVLDTVLWMYYVNLPMLFFPVDIIRRFGFNPPSGVFASPSTAVIIKKSMPEDDYILFKEYSGKKEIVNSHLDWFNSLPDLTDQQIWDTADERRELNDSILSYYVKQLAGFRAKCEMVVEMIRKQLTDKSKEPTIDTDTVSSYLNFFKWREIYHKL
jgi:hypothetical protein